MEVDLDAILPTNVLEAFPHALHMWFNYVPYGFVVDVLAVNFMVSVFAVIIAAARRLPYLLR